MGRIDEIEEAADAPAKATGDAGSVEAHPLPDQLEVERATRGDEATSPGQGLGVKITKVYPPGATE